MEPNFEEFPDAMPLYKQNKQQEKNKDKVPANEKNGNYYKDIKQSQAHTETSTTKTTENLTEKPTEEYTTKEPLEDHDNHFQKPNRGQNEPEFWTNLEKALNETSTREEHREEKDQLFNPIPNSDLDLVNKETVSDLEDIKLKLMLGISLMSLFLFLTLLTFGCATLYKLRQLSKQKCESQYSINPELAEMSYFHPSEGISDTSFSKSTENSMFWANNSSEFRKSGIRKSNSRNTADMTSTSLDEGSYINEDVNEEIPP
ncbi:equatorin [Orycteropus afer afer]|uniref:Equatorin n=1 Tax=Orycteropus afer afer TaxID=1230840 RepID=A0A8B7AEB6_ORYAF|nr:equatorin [Orycteropus afer afer]